MFCIHCGWHTGSEQDLQNVRTCRWGSSAELECDLFAGASLIREFCQSCSLCHHTKAQSQPHRSTLSCASLSPAEQEDIAVSGWRLILIQRAILVSDRLLRYDMEMDGWHGQKC